MKSLGLLECHNFYNLSSSWLKRIVRHSFGESKSFIFPQDCLSCNLNTSFHCHWLLVKCLSSLTLDWVTQFGFITCLLSLRPEIAFLVSCLLEAVWSQSQNGLCFRKKVLRKELNLGFKTYNAGSFNNLRSWHLIIICESASETSFREFAVWWGFFSSIPRRSSKNLL